MSFKITSCRVLHQGRSFRFTLEQVQLQDGQTIDVEMVRHPGAAAIAAITPQGQVIMLRQFRHSVGNFIWELPAGTLAPAEPAEACARRELVEEAGLRAARWELLGEIYALPGYSDETIHLFLARDLSHAPQNLDPDEMLTVHPIAFDDCLEMIQAGQIRDAKTMAAFLRLSQRHRLKPLF